MAGLYPSPDGAYSIAGLGQVYGQFYDGGPRGYRDDPWQRHNIIGGGQQSWLSADIAASLQSYSQQLTTQGVAAPTPMNFDFTLTLPALPPLPDLVLPPAQTQPIYTNIPNVQVAPAPNIGGALPPFQRPPAGRAQIPGVGGRGGGGGGGGGLVRHPLMNTLGVAAGHSDTAFGVPAAGDLLYHTGAGWGRLPKAAAQHTHLTSNAGLMPQWAPVGIAALGGNLISAGSWYGRDMDISVDPGVVPLDESEDFYAGLVFKGKKLTIVSGVVTESADVTAAITLQPWSDPDECQMWFEADKYYQRLRLRHGTAGTSSSPINVALSGAAQTLTLTKDVHGHVKGLVVS